MRVLFITNLYPPHDVGGYEQMCQETAEQLAERGHEVIVLTSRHGVGSSQTGLDEPTVFRQLHLQTDLDRYEPIRFLTKRSLEDRQNITRLRRVIRDYTPHVAMVWGMWNLSHSIPYWTERWMPGRTVYYISSYWPTDPDPDWTYWQLPALHPVRQPIKDLVKKRLAFKSNQYALKFENVLCVSQHVRNALVGAGKIPEAARVSYLGVDPQPFLASERFGASNENRPLRLVYFGRLIADKGVHTAVEALGLLKERGVGKRVELTVVGSGPSHYEERLRQAVNTFGLQDSVRFVKKVPRAQVPGLLRQFDVFLFTSVWAEPFARTALEALASGLVLIASNVGGTPELFEHGYDPGLLFPAGDAEALAERIARVSEAPALRSHLAALGRRLVSKRFTLSHLVDDIEASLHAVVAGDESAAREPALIAG